MAPHQTYRRSAAASWTRIDLLLIVYDVGVETARRGREAAAIGDEPEVTRRQVKLQQVIVALLDGLDPAQQEATQRMQRLCLFMLERSQRGTPADWDAVLRILTTLREGFAAIRDEAAELEARGAIPPVDAARYVSAMA